jgi:predicted helicase
MGACSSTCGCGRNGSAAPARLTTAIDLVAQEVDTGDLWAIQCKFYEPVHTLSKPDIDSLLSALMKALSALGGNEVEICHGVAYKQHDVRLCG